MSRLIVFTPATGEKRVIPSTAAMLAAVLEATGTHTVQIRPMAVASPAAPATESDS